MEEGESLLTDKPIQWTRNLTNLPPFTHELLKQHLITDTSSKHGKPPNAHKYKKFGYQLFKDKLVSQVKVKANVKKGEASFFLVKSSVHASMKKTQYDVYVHLHQETGKVSLASCSCKAGLGGCCKHVAALLFQLLDLIQLEATEVPDDLTCTQLLQQWHVPRTEEMKTAVLFDNVKFSKATAQKTKKTNYEYSNPAPSYAKQVKVSDINKLKDGLNKAGTCKYFEGLLESNNCQPWDYNDFMDGLPSKKQFTEADLKASQLFNVEIRETILQDIKPCNFTDSTKYVPSPAVVPFVKEKLYVTKEELNNIEMNTRGQAESSLWFEERRKRLTASNFGSVINRREKIFPKSILSKQFKKGSSANNSPAPCVWGKNNEQTAISKYVDKVNREGKSINACTQCGFLVNPETPWLGASPDCFLFDPCECKPCGVGEVKCPFSKMDMSIEEACNDSSFFLTVHEDKCRRPTLKKTHSYYYQLQGLMSTCKVEWADFIVYTKKEVFCQRVYFDRELWLKTMLPKLTSFYFTYIYPELKY